MSLSASHQSVAAQQAASRGVLRATRQPHDGKELATALVPGDASDPYVRFARLMIDCVIAAAAADEGALLDDIHPAGASPQQIP